MGIREISFRKTVSVLSIASFLTVAQWATTTFAAERDLGPKGRNAAGETGMPETSATAAAKAGEEAGKTVSQGLSIGTIGFSLAMVAGTIAIAVTALGGGNTTTSGHH